MTRARHFWAVAALVCIAAASATPTPSEKSSASAFKPVAAETSESEEAAVSSETETQETAESRPGIRDDRDKRQSYYSPLQQAQQAQQAQQVHLQLQRFPNLGGAPPQGFRAAPVQERDEALNRNTLAPTASPSPILIQRPQQSATTPQYRPTASPSPVVYRTAVPSTIPQQRRPAPTQATRYRQPVEQQLQQVTDEELSEELEAEKEEPDRLTELLPHSKFSCQNRNTGYYADEGLSCEVFHYCQDGARHSWVCPEGFTFHQVHLICMPPSSENICQKSSNFFFVNDYLYRPINAEEVGRKPNVSLRYAERYYPQTYPDVDEPDQAPAQQNPHRVPIQQGFSTASPLRRPQPVQQTNRPLISQSLGGFRPSNQVFHSPEEVNIPLQLRRPLATTARSTSSEEYDYDETPYHQGRCRRSFDSGYVRGKAIHFDGRHSVGAIPYREVKPKSKLERERFYTSGLPKSMLDSTTSDSSTASM